MVTTRYILIRCAIARYSFPSYYYNLRSFKDTMVESPEWSILLSGLLKEGNDLILQKGGLLVWLIDTLQTYL
jgi:hypothetical protein